MSIGILLLNLGGPDSLDAVRPFLYNLFSDREIIRLGPAFLQKPLAWLISSLRSKKTERMYSLIGGKSPILDITMAQAEALEKALNTKDDGRETMDERRGMNDEIVHRLSEQSERSSIIPSALHFKVYIGMRYWHPFIKDTVDRILKDGIKQLIVLSLYPHYSKATTGSAIAEFKRVISHFSLLTSHFPIKYIEQWYDFPPYIEAVTDLIYKGISEFKENENPPPSPFSKGGLNGSPPLANNTFYIPPLTKDSIPIPPLAKDSIPIPPLTKGGEGGFDIHILYSAHSLPESFIKKGDPYLDHIKTTITEINKRLALNPYNISNLKWHLSFQSKSGPVRWLSPATGEVIIRLADEGCKNLFIVPVSFVSEHIETLYEIDILYKGLAEKHGMNLKRCPSLNTSEKFIEALKELVMTTVNKGFKD